MTSKVWKKLNNLKKKSERQRFKKVPKSGRSSTLSEDLAVNIVRRLKRLGHVLDMPTDHTCPAFHTCVLHGCVDRSSKIEMPKKNGATSETGPGRPR